MICRHCGKPIDYDKRFYAVGPAGAHYAELVHARCEEEFIEREESEPQPEMQR